MKTIFKMNKNDTEAKNIKKSCTHKAVIYFKLEPGRLPMDALEFNALNDMDAYVIESLESIK